MTLAELRSQVIEVAGLDLTATEADALINEAHRALCIQSEWTRAYVELGPGVADQQTYDFPANAQRIFKVSIDGRPLFPSSQEDYERVVLGELQTDEWWWWITYTDDGSEKVAVYPTPSGGEAITAYCLVYPADSLTDDGDEPLTPAEPGDRAILNYVTAQVLGNAEDDTERRDYFLGEFARLAQDLRGLRYSRGARKNARIRIRGITA